MVVDVLIFKDVVRVANALRHQSYLRIRDMMLHWRDYEPGYLARSTLGIYMAYRTP
jgi:hypothetical protein